MQGRIRLGAYALSINDGAVLLAQISENDPMLTPGEWTLPGGGLDWGEDPEAGMHRELYEETGLTGTVNRVLGVDSFLFRPKGPDPVHSIRVVYEVACQGEPEVTEIDGTVSDARWIPLSELDDYPLVNLVHFALGKAGLA